MIFSGPECVSRMSLFLSEIGEPPGRLLFFLRRGANFQNVHCRRGEEREKRRELWVIHGGLSQMAPSTLPSGSTARIGWCPKPCKWGGGCPYLRRRCCLFGHSSDEVASASLVGMQLPMCGPTREEHEALVAAVRRLAAALMWSRGTAVEPVMTTQDNFGERSGPVPVPQTKENVVVSTQVAPHVHEHVVEPLDQPGDQARRDSADAVYQREQPGDQTCVELLQTQYIDKVAASLRFKLLRRQWKPRRCSSSAILWTSL